MIKNGKHVNVWDIMLPDGTSFDIERVRSAKHYTPERIQMMYEAVLKTGNERKLTRLVDKLYIINHVEDGKPPKTEYPALSREAMIKRDTERGVMLWGDVQEGITWEQGNKTGCRGDDTDTFRVTYA